MFFLGWNFVSSPICTLGLKNLKTFNKKSRFSSSAKEADHGGGPMQGPGAETLPGAEPLVSIRAGAKAPEAECFCPFSYKRGAKS